MMPNVVWVCPRCGKRAFPFLHMCIWTHVPDEHLDVPKKHFPEDD